MVSIQHRFLNHRINPETEILLLGTFNPDTPANDAEFFYGRKRNFLWRLLPSAFGETDLKDASTTDKSAFLRKHKIDFIDLIEEVVVEPGQEANYSDGYIDSKVIRWTNVIAAIDHLPKLKKVCFTRKTFSDIPNMRKQIDIIQAYCSTKGIPFFTLMTPARIYSMDKQSEWTIILLKETK